MRVDDDVIKENGVSNGDAGDATPNKTKDGSKLTLRMVFVHRNSEHAKRRYRYNVKCVSMNCTGGSGMVLKKIVEALVGYTNLRNNEFKKCSLFY